MHEIEKTLLEEREEVIKIIDETEEKFNSSKIIEQHKIRLSMIERDLEIARVLQSNGFLDLSFEQKTEK